MKRLLLTSAGLTEDMKELFWREIGKPPGEARVLFIPAAGAAGDGAREGISLCAAELVRMGIPWGNITLYPLQYLLSAGYRRTYSQDCPEIPPELRLMEPEELLGYDAVVASGGDAALLVAELNRTGLAGRLRGALERGLFYIGVSAGSMAAAGNFPDGLGMISEAVWPHAGRQEASGGGIALPDGRALFVRGDGWEFVS